MRAFSCSFLKKRTKKLLRVPRLIAGRARGYPACAAAGLVLLAGCGGSAPRQVYVLAATPSPEIGVHSTLGTPIVSVMPVRLPDYLDNTDMLRQTGPHQVTASLTGLWGERLSVGVTNAVASRLAALRPAELFPTTQPARPAPSLLIEITSLEVGPDGKCHLQARWQVLAANAETVLSAEQGGFTATGAAVTDAALAASISDVVAQLAAAIAATLPPGRAARA